ncbi:MAG: cupin domain-containing protein [Desulfobacteraceae bacterium]|jgi:dTDP-4-dehydrorhamnose 3,5-epimerase-like enzyme
MDRKIKIEDLPITEEFLRQKRLIQERGELALIEDGKDFKHLGYFSLKKGKGYSRGGHYHIKKIEHFYIISGKLRVRLVDLESGEESETNLHEGQRVTIYPKCAHRFEAEEDAQVIEYYDCRYEPDDDVPYDDF